MNKGINFNNFSNEEMQKLGKAFINNYSKQLGRKIPFHQPNINEPAPPFSDAKPNAEMQEFEDKIKKQLEDN